MSYSSLKYLFTIVLISYTLTGYGQRLEKTNRMVLITQSPVVLDSLQIAAFYQGHPELISGKAQLLDFYDRRAYAYAWFAAGRLTEQAGNLVNRMINLPDEGIYTAIPYQQELVALIDQVNVQQNNQQNNVTLELLLTAQYFVFSKLAWNGMNNAASKSSGWYLPRKKMAYDQYLDSLLAAPDKPFTSAEPVYRQYELLKSFLRKYRALDTGSTWPPIVLPLPRLKPGDSAPVVALIKARLFKLEDYHGDTLNNRYDTTLQNAVKQFQFRHGLPVNGLPDKATLAELNIPLKSRIGQILVNMEKSRWLPVTLSSVYLAVNIPEFKLHVYYADSLLWSCNAVVGQTMHQTTVFYGEIKYVVFSPYWNVPPSIVRNEIMPGIKNDPNYLTKHAMEITGYLDGLPLVRQKPGPMNSLGLVKFIFPNSYNIYLHDTPSKSLFGESSRAFSHGCIRIAEPFRLANFLLKEDKEWTSEKIAAAMHAGKERYVTLAQKVPVFVAYFTALTDRNNRLNFRKDIYNLDEELAALILSGNGVY